MGRRLSEIPAALLPGCASRSPGLVPHRRAVSGAVRKAAASVTPLHVRPECATNSPSVARGIRHENNGCWVPAAALVAILAMPGLRARTKEDLDRRHGHGGRRQARSASDGDGADKGLLNWMFNGLVRIKPGPGQARSSSSPISPRAGLSNADRHRVDLQDPHAACSATRLRRVHRRGCGLLAEARGRQGDARRSRRLRRDRQGRGAVDKSTRARSR